MRQPPTALGILRSGAITAAGLAMTLLASSAARAQTNGSPDPLSIYNSLPADQQQAILQQVGGQAVGQGGWYGRCRG